VRGYTRRPKRFLLCNSDSMGKGQEGKEDKMRKKNKSRRGDLFRKDLSRREFLKITGGALVGSNLFSESFSNQKSFAQEKVHEPIPPIELFFIEEAGPEIARILIESWGKLGLKVNPTIQPGHIFVPKAYKREYEHIAYCWWSSMPERLDPGFWVSEFYHSRNAKPGGRNWGDYINPNADKLIDQQEQELDQEKRRELVWKIQAEVAKDHPIWYVAHNDLFTLYNSQKWDGLVNMLGCPPNRADTPWSLVNMVPKGREKIFRWGFTIDHGSRNPFAQTNASSFGFFRLIYDRFVQISKELEPVPWAAESWKWVNKTTLDLKIRKGMRFHDGKPVTPEDAAFSFEYVLKHKIPRYGVITANLEGVKLMDDGTIRLFLKRPSASFVGTALIWGHIIPKHIWEKIDKPLDFEDPQLIGSGPFKIREWKKGEKYFFESNKEHFSQPKIDGFYLLIIPSLEAQVGLLESGEIDFIEHRLLAYSLAKEIAKKPNIDLIITPNPGFHEVRPKCTLRPFNDIEFRRAINHAIPRETILKVVMEGQGTMAHNTPITPRNKYWHNPDILIMDFNLDKSREILKKAGYNWDEKGRLCFAKKI